MAETMKGKAVTGDNVGRSESVTGDEPGMSRALPVLNIPSLKRLEMRQQK
jgi:hypothetical protein